MVHSDLIAGALQELAAAPQRLVVALSGGLDSLVLLDLTLRAVAEQPSLAGCEVSAVHVNHGLADQADAWEAFCAELCTRQGLTLEVCRVMVPESGNLEANAREARYAAFVSRLRAGDVLLLAHHFDDQLETWMFRTLRGDAVRGMPAHRRLGPALLLRPLLDVPRSALSAYAKAQDLTALDDPSNLDTRFSRNLLRHEVLPRLRQHDSGFDARARAAMLLDAERGELIGALGELDLMAVEGPQTILLSAMLNFESVRQQNLLRRWFVAQGRTQPARSALTQLLTELKAGRRLDLRVGDARVALHRGRLHLLSAELPGFPQEPVSWRGEPRLSFASGLLTAERAPGGVWAAQLMLRPARRGERISGRAARDLLREAGVPPWDRTRVPLLCAGDKPVAVAAYGPTGSQILVAEAPRTVAHGWHFCWHPRA